MITEQTDSEALYVQASSRSYITNIPLSDLSIDPHLQRKYIQPTRIARMVKKFHPDALGVLEVSQRLSSTGGAPMNHVLDGYHRTLMLRELRKLEKISADFLVTCKVLVGLTTQEEAILFELLNDKQKVGRPDLFRMRLAAEDPAALDIMRIIDKNKWELSENTRKGGLSAIGALEDAYALSPVAAEKALTTLTRAWDKSSATVHGEMIQGFTMFYNYYGNAVDRTHLVNALSNTYLKASNFLRFARETKVRGTTRNAIAKVTTETYNFGKSTRALPPWPHNGRKTKDAPIALNTMDDK